MPPRRKNKNEKSNENKKGKEDETRDMTRRELEDSRESEYSRSFENPYTKDEAYSLFRVKNDRFAYNFNRVKWEMKDALLGMNEHGYDFRFIIWKFKREGKGRNYMKFNRKVYMRF